MKCQPFVLCFLISILLYSCKPSPQELAQKYKDEKIMLSGIHLNKEILNDFYSEGVSTDQFIAALNTKKEKGVKVDKAEVIVDMSAGMNIGIDKSFKAITSVMQRFNPSEVKYFHVDDGANPEPLNEIKSLSDANFLQNPASYRHSYSKLIPAFESATKSNDKITIVITDFLLDEGLKTDRRLKNGKFIKEESADNSTWASAYFTKWFLANNQVLIYPFKYTAANYYNKQETKNIYYLVFVPKGCISDRLNNLKSDFAGIFPEMIDLNPGSVALKINEQEIPGACVEGYNSIKGQGNKYKVFADYSSEYIPFSFQGLKKSNYYDKPVSCNMTVENGSPFRLKIVTEGYDISANYYKALETPGSEWKKTELHKDAKPSNEIICDVLNDSALTFKFGPEVVKENYMAKYKTLSKLLYSRIMVKGMTLKSLSSALSWDFESKYGTMENNALSESVRLALEEYINNNVNYPIGSILLSVHDK